MLSTISLMVLALAPFVAGLLFRRAALRPGATADQVWFPFCQRIYWLGLVNVIVWPTIYTWLCTPMWSRLFPGLQPTAFGLLMAAGVLVQLVAVQMFLSACVQEVNRRVRGADVRAPNAALQGMWVMVRVFVGTSALVVGITAFLRGGLFVAVVALLAGVVGMVVLGRLARPPKRWLPHAVTSGELRDRVFALAASAGVKLNQLYVLPMAHSRVANALAVQNQTVMITDYLLPHLSRDQLDAVMAHELAHLQRRHPAWLGVALLVGLTGVWTAWQIAHIPTMVSFPVMFIGFLALSRRFEYAADAGAVAIGARPDALITGLAVLGRLNHMPVRWSQLREWTLTHPSTERRARAFAKRGGIDPARIPELLATAADPPRDPYVLPRGAHEDRVFSSSFKAAALMRNGWTLVLVNVSSAVVFALLGSALGIHGMARPFAFLPLAVLVFGVTFVVLQHIAMRPYRSLRKPLCERFERMGFDPRGRETEMVGLAPNDRARYYEGIASWDVGFLWFRPDRLIFLGEETSFSLTRDEILSLEPGPSFPGWVRPRGLCVRWSRRDQSGAFTLQAVGAEGLLTLPRETRRLTQRLEAWRTTEASAAGRLPAPVTQPSSPPVPIPIAPPPTGEVTGVDPEDMLKPGAVVITLFIHLVLVAIVAPVAGLGLGAPRGLGMLDAMLASAIAYTLLLAPMARGRRHRRPDERAERRAA